MNNPCGSLRDESFRQREKPSTVALNGFLSVLMEPLRGQLVVVGGGGHAMNQWESNEGLDLECCIDDC